MHPFIRVCVNVIVLWLRDRWHTKTFFHELGPITPSSINVNSYRVRVERLTYVSHYSVNYSGHVSVQQRCQPTDVSRIVLLIEDNWVCSYDLIAKKQAKWLAQMYSSDWNVVVLVEFLSNSGFYLFACQLRCIYYSIIYHGFSKNIAFCYLRHMLPLRLKHMNELYSPL